MEVKVYFPHITLIESNFLTHFSRKKITIYLPYRVLLMVSQNQEAAYIQHPTNTMQLKRRSATKRIFFSK